MKDNIVFWGANEQDQKILVILRLRNSDHKVDIWTFMKDKLEDEFVEKMFEDWDNIDVSTFPEPTTYEERDVTSTDLLPENVKAHNTELVIRTEEEWRVKVLSSRIFEMMANEVTALNEQVKTLDQYDKTLWETAKGYNSKLNIHSQERNFTRDQFGELNQILNECFDKLKTMMNEENKQYEEQAVLNKKQILQKLAEFDKQAEDDSMLGKIFNDLKAFQTEIKSIRLTRDGRKEVWDKINESFQNIKDRRKSMAGFKLDKRINGLRNAINKMENSIRRDQESVDFQTRQAQHVNAGKLEMQLRAAKAKMLDSRIDSKTKKLDDMKKTLTELMAQLRSVEAKAKKDADAPKSKAEKPKVAADTPKAEKPKAEAPKVDTPKADTPKAETPKVEAPTVETPKVETPTVETPKVETPAVETPKVEAPTVETPKVETPAVEETAEKPDEE